MPEYNEVVCIFSPGEELDFCVTDDSRETLDILSLSNNTEKHVAFKVKTTSPEKYRVRPSTGIVRPKGSAEISVYLHPGIKSTTYHHRCMNNLFITKKNAFIYFISFLLTKIYTHYNIFYNVASKPNNKKHESAIHCILKDDT